MSKKADMVDASKTLQDLVSRVGRYPEDAFLFVRDGLSHAAENVHGPETDSQRTLHEFLSQHDLDWNDLVAAHEAQQLPKPIMDAIDTAGGCEKLNRHISGRQLCWGLRDLALARWGMLARTVLESWNIRDTRDFGRIVFAFIDLEMMRKQPEDRVEDFDGVFDFREAFDRAFRDGSPPRTPPNS
jgi:uncharacterized repeat protein (TIGR04138 family)